MTVSAITWGDSASEAAVVSADELRGRLIELNQHAAARPFIVDVTIDNGDTISIALGREIVGPELHFGIQEAALSCE